MKKLLVILAILFLYIWAGRGVGFHFALFQDLQNTVAFIRDQWFPMDMSDYQIVVKSLLVTVQIALFSTVTAVVIALPLGFLAARTWSPAKWIYNSSRIILNGYRAIPELVLALLFIPMVGLGPIPAVLALVIHNIGVFGKLISEIIESVDEGPQEAVAAVGGSKLQVALYGIIPQILPLLFSQYFYRLEVAIRTTLILGIVGAGGIGQLLYNDFKQYFYTKVTFEVFMIMILITLVDYIGAIIRKRVT